MTEDARRHAPATTRNRDAILAVLRDALPPRGILLEIASGTGEHAVYFAGALPGLTWQPSDPDARARASIAAWTAATGLANIRPPLALDAQTSVWPIEGADAILCVNMVHISPWRATLGLLDGAARILPHGAPLILYGPYLRPDMETAPSNLAFDADLKARNPEWGLRDLADVDREAGARGVVRQALVEMPANNLSLIFHKA